MCPNLHFPAEMVTFTEEVLNENFTFCGTLSLKLANTKLVLKKRCKNQKENYKPVSTIAILSELFEKISSKQLPSYFQSFNLVLGRVFVLSSACYF